MGFPGGSDGKESAGDQIWSLGREGPWKKGITIHSSILAWRIPWTQEPGRLYSPWVHKELDMNEQLTNSMMEFCEI